MPIPSDARPQNFDPVNWGGDACTQMRNLVAVNGRLRSLLSFMFNEDGTVSNNWKADLFPWVYGALTDTGSAGSYIVASTPPYSTVNATNLAGRVVFFKAGSDSVVGSTLKLDDLTAYIIKDSFGVPLIAGSIKANMTVGVIWDGSNWIAFTPLSQSSVFVIPRRAYSAVQVAAGLKTDFPKDLTLSLTKVSGGRWGNVELVVNGSFHTHDEGIMTTCAIKWNNGSLSGTDVGGTGAGNVAQHIPVTILNASGTPAWHVSFEVPDADKDINTLEFKATITMTGINGGATPDLAVITDIPTQHFHGTGHYFMPLS